MERHVRGAAQPCIRAQRLADDIRTSAAPASRWVCQVLAGMIDVEGVVGMLDGRDPQAARREQRDQARQEGRFAAPLQPAIPITFMAVL